MTIENPALTQVYSRVNGGGTTFTTGDTPFEDDDVFVYIFNESTGNYEVKTVTTDYTLSGSTVTFNSPTPSGTGNILILRRSDLNALQIPNFTPGSSIRGQDLDSNFEQLLRVCQEHRDLKVDKFFPEIYGDLDLNGKRIKNVGDAVDDGDAPNRKQLGDVIALDITSNETQGIVLEKTQSGSNSGDEMVITAHDSSATQKGVVKITAPVVTDGNPITLTRPAGGEIELTIENNSIDVQKIKGLDKADTSEYYLDWTGDDDQVATVGALAARLDAVVSPSQPTTAQTGKFWYDPTEGINALYMWNGTIWKVLTSGTPYIPAGTTIVRYVDHVNGSDDVNNSGFLPQSPLQTIKRAITLINASATGDGTLVVVEPGVYQEALPLTIQKNNVSVVGKSLRSCFIHPTVATENNNMWEVDSGTYISGFTMLGLKVPTSDQGSRNNTLDNDATYGLPSNQPFAVSFRSGNPVILKSPYVQNCTHFSDAHFDNSNFDPNTFQSTDAQTYSAVAGDQTSAPCGGGLLIDGAAVSSSSPIRSMVVDAFTQICLDGPGVLVTNNGYAQLVSFFGTFTHYHAKAKNGGQINLSNCVSDFGRYGLIADGHGDTFATATSSAANIDATVVTVSALTTTAGHHVTATQPLDHMMMTINSVDYGVVSSVANGSGWDVTVTPPLSNSISSSTASFSLRSYISTGGHTFEYVGVGTNYGDHPDKGGQAIEANQVIELNGGKVWQSSTDHVGKFKAGNVLVVDQVSETVDLKDTTVTGNMGVTGNVAITGNATVTGTINELTVSRGPGNKNTNTVVGDGAVASLTTGNRATGIGDGALSMVESGDDNTAVGNNALAFNVSGDDNTAVGSSSFRRGTGDDNTAVGSDAMSLYNTGDYNTVVGSHAAANSNDGDGNTVVGGYAYIGGEGENNTTVGRRSLHGITGDLNVCLGYEAGLQLSTGSNNIIIGSQGQASATAVSNEVTIGDANISKFRVPGIDFVLKDNGGTPSSGQVLTADSNGEGYWANSSGGGGGGGATAIDNLSDVDTSTVAPTDGQALVWDNAASKWEPGTVLANVVEDTTPQLGGPLDVQAQEINTSTTNGNIKLTPDGTGVVEIKGNTGNDAAIQLNCEQNTHGVKIKSPPHSAAASYTLTLPDDTGTSNQLLTTDGSGNLSWSTVTGGGAATVDTTSLNTNFAINPDSGTMLIDQITANRTYTDDMASGESVTMMVSRSNTNYSITWPTIKWVGGSQPILPTGSTAYAIITVWKADTTLFGSYGGDAS